MNAEALRSQIRSLVQTRMQVQSHKPQATESSTASSAVVIPLRLYGPEDMHLLTQLLQRLAASPTLSQAAAAGLVRLDISVGQGALVACCEPCQTGSKASCSCSTSAPKSVESAPSAAAAELSGLVSEKSVRKLGANIRQVSLAAHAVLTPMGRDELKRRGISLLPNKKG